MVLSVNQVMLMTDGFPKIRTRIISIVDQTEWQIERENRMVKEIVMGRRNIFTPEEQPEIKLLCFFFYVCTELAVKGASWLALSYLDKFLLFIF